MTQRFLLGLIGANLANSLMPDLQEFALRGAGAAGLYHAMDLEALGLTADDLPRLMDAAQLAGFAATGITHPCKERVIALLDEVSPAARSLGAVNLVCFRDGRRIGHNTDWSGFRQSVLDRFPTIGRRLDTVTVVGAGGAGRAVVHALLDLGAGRVLVCDAAEGKAAALAAAFPGGKVAAAADPAGALPGSDGLVNATPIGMYGYEGTPVAPALLHAGLWVGDVIYTPVETRLILDARARGLETLTGDGMNLNQAIEGFRLMTGLEPDVAAMAGEYARLLAAARTRGRAA
jgi:shikimate dehydrogenase